MTTGARLCLEIWCEHADLSGQYWLRAISSRCRLLHVYCHLNDHKSQVHYKQSVVGDCEPFSSVSAFDKYRPSYIVNFCFVFIWDKNFLIEWIFFKLGLSAISYSVTSNPRQPFSRVLSFNGNSKYLPNTTRISKASPASHNTIFREVSGNFGQFSTAGPNLIFFNTVIPSNITIACEMACSSFVCDAFAYFISSLSHALRQLFSTPKIVYHHLWIETLEPLKTRIGICTFQGSVQVFFWTQLKKRIIDFLSSFKTMTRSCYFTL